MVYILMYVVSTFHFFKFVCFVFSYLVSFVIHFHSYKLNLFFIVCSSSSEYFNYFFLFLILSSFTTITQFFFGFLMLRF